MGTASPPEDYIYQGVWNNFLRGGKVFGTTLTVSPVIASVLSPALALIVSVAGSQLWRLLQFALHQIRATNREKNFLFHQQQVTLRNTANDLNTLWRLLRLAVAYRRHKDIKVFWESFPLLLWTSCHLTLVILVGLFSSWLLQASNDVLSRSPWCGQYSQDYINAVRGPNWSEPAIFPEACAYNNYFNSRLAIAQQHLDVCNISSEGCNVLVRTALQYNKTVLPNVCPFSDSICHPNASTIQFDTGYLSSAADLGLNAPDKDRVSFRMLAKCAPLDDAKHVTGWQAVNATSDLPAHQVSDALYGPGIDPLRNATFSYTKPVMECVQQAILLPYTLNSVFCPAGGSIAAGDATFDPIPQLQSTDADTSLIMLMSNERYQNPVVDPWFTAQLPETETNAYCRGKFTTLYTRETPLTTIGCTQQWQICNTDSSAEIGTARCTALQGIEQLYETFVSSSNFTASFNPQQMATINWIIGSIAPASFYYWIKALAQTTGPPIKARDLITDTVGISVPDTQWQIETDYWMQGLLAYIQQSSMDSSTGQFAVDTKYINITTPKTDATGSAYRLCQNQIIHSTSYRNFNFFALLLCVILCAIITTLGLTIEDLIGYIREHRSEDSKCQRKKDMWFINSDLEMLRIITELKSKLRWSRSSFGIPYAPANAKAVIDDLRSDIGDGCAKHKMSYTSRRGTVATSASSSERRRAHGYSVHHHNKSCATCESFEMVSTGSDSTLANPSPNDQRHESYNADEALTQRSHLGAPLLQTSEQTLLSGMNTPPRPGVQPLQPSQARHHHARNYLRLNASAESNTAEPTPSFLYNNDIPLSTDLSTDPVAEHSRHGMPMLTTDESDSDHPNRSRMNFGLRSKNVSDSGERGLGRSWPWSRRQESSGTIC